MSALLHDIRNRISKNIAPIGTAGEYAYSSPQSLLVPQTVDEAEMSAEFVIVSDVEDREYDVINPRGCEEYLEEYRRNPIVLLEHDCLKPIGLSQDKSGLFHFRVMDDRIIAKCFFHCSPLNGENLSEEVFRLVMKGVFRGASPGFLPLRARKRGYGKNDGMSYESWRLTEWSITTQPVNQLALRMSIGGVRCKSLRTTLESLVLPKSKSTCVVGGFEGESVNRKSFDESKHPRDGGKFTSGHHSGEAAKHSQSAYTAASERRKYFFNKKPSDVSGFAHDASKVAHQATQSSNPAAANLHRKAERDHFKAWEHHSKRKNEAAADHHNKARLAHAAAANAHDAEKKGAKSMSKPKTASIEFDKDIFATEAACVAWINAHGMDASSCERLPTSFIFRQRNGLVNAGKKSLGKGVTALLTKAFGKKDEEDSDDDKKKKKDEKQNDMADDKVEKADESPDDEDEDDDEIDDVEDSDAEVDDADNESEEAEGETGAEDETEYDPAALKKEADNLVDMIAHFELACEHAERMKGESVKSPDLFVKLHADAQALVKDLRAAYKDGFADQAMEDAINERKQGAAEQEQVPADDADAAPDEYKEMAKALKAARKEISEANAVAKALPRLSVA